MDDAAEQQRKVSVQSAAVLVLKSTQYLSQSQIKTSAVQPCVTEESDFAQLANIHDTIRRHLTSIITTHCYKKLKPDLKPKLN